MSSTCSFLLHSGEKDGPSSRVHSNNTLKSVILEAKSAGLGGGGISFYLKQTWLTNGDWPHCGQTSDQLVTWLFHVQNAANLRLLWTQRIKRNRLLWILFPSLRETVGHLRDCHSDGEVVIARLAATNSYVQIFIWTSNSIWSCHPALRLAVFW